MTTKWVGLLDQVDNIIVLARSASVSPGGSEGDYLQAQLCRYGCLLGCAALEQVLIESLSDYARRAGDERLRVFVAEVLATGKSPYPENICATVGRFDPAWNVKVAEYIENDIGPFKINSVVSNRNRIAHGESVDLGVKSLLEWVPAVRRLCRMIADLIEKQVPTESLPSRRQRKRERKRHRRKRR